VGPAVPLWLLAMVACSPQPPELPGVEADRAWIEDLDLGTVAVVGGVVTGQAMLRIEDDGRQWGFPVELRGGVVGAVLELGVGFNWAPIELQLPRSDVPGDELLGTYKGFSGGLAIIGGFDGRSLKNKHGVRLRGSPFQLGLSVNASYEWLKIRLPEETGVGSESFDTGDYANPPPTCGSGCSDWDIGFDTGDSGGTAQLGARRRPRGGLGGGGSLAMVGLVGWGLRRRRRDAAG